MVVGIEALLIDDNLVDAALFERLLNSSDLVKANLHHARRLNDAIATLAEQHTTFSGGSWTNDRSWVEGYDNVIGPMERLSARFHQAIDRVPTNQQPHLALNPNYRQALLHNLLLQTSCFRYWGQGQWTDYAETIYQRGCEFVARGFA